MLVPVARPASATASATRTAESHRAILRVSQWPYHDHAVFNAHGRLSDNHPSRGATSASSASSTGSAKRRRCDDATTILGASDAHRAVIDDNRPIHRRTRRRETENRVEWQLAMIIHCGTSERHAHTLLHEWNHRSRGPIPRAAWGYVLSVANNLDAYYNFEVIFNTHSISQLSAPVLGAPLVCVSAEHNALVVRPRPGRAEAVRAAVRCIDEAVRRRAEEAEDAEAREDDTVYCIDQ